MDLSVFIVRPMISKLARTVPALRQQRFRRLFLLIDPCSQRELLTTSSGCAILPAKIPPSRQYRAFPKIVRPGGIGGTGDRMPHPSTVVPGVELLIVPLAS